ncbi:MAG: translation initiation factor IF-2 [Thermonemataceae bacterium]|nr:translation initiation factor IF-2 [Thermonemataceae bacterium]
MRLNQAARHFNVATTKIVETLAAKGLAIDNNPNSKLNAKQIEILEKEFRSSLLEKQEATHKASLNKVVENKQHTKVVEKKKEEAVSTEETPQEQKNELVELKPEIENKIVVEQQEKVQEPHTEKKIGLSVVGKIDLDAQKNKFQKQKTQEYHTKDKKDTKNFKEQKDKKFEKKPYETSNNNNKQNFSEKGQKKVEETKKTFQQPKQEIPLKVENKIEEKKNIPTEETINPVELIKAKAETLKGLTVLDKIVLPVENSRKKNKPLASSDNKDEKKKKRKRIKKNTKPNTENKVNQAGTTTTTSQEQKSKVEPNNNQQNNKKKRIDKEEPTGKEIQSQIKATFAKMGGNTQKKKSIKKVLRKERENEDLTTEQGNHLKVTEFISANDLANLMDVSINQLISKCLSLGMFVSINQRLDAEAITIIADEFGYSVEFISAEEEIDAEVEEQVDDEKDLEPRSPIVTVMGHVDHGKTSLLDYIRRSNVVAKESGGITQHIGAYSVKTENGKKITFLDTPGHEAFTAMRARGAKLTDVAIIVVAADDSVMPQTKEAINHAQLAGVPIVFAISKVDKPTANTERIREQLAQENILVEEWGGKYQSQEISSKSGLGINELLEKVLLEAEILDLKANPNKNAIGAVIDATLDKGRGYVSNILIQSGTLKIGDIILVGALYGRVKAMTDHTGKPIKKAGPSTPVQILGLSGAPQAGDKFQVLDTEREAKEIANKREQILREQSIRATKRLTLSDIGRRIALGSFKQLNIIIKGDVDGSVEALSDSLLKLSTEEIQVNVIQKAVGQITETDVNLATISDAIIIGFQVRPSVGARKLAEQEQVEIRLYSIIYDAINEVKDAMEGMLAPQIEEVIVGNLDIRQTFRISKVGTIAGCMVTDGYIKRQSKIRIIRDGIVIHTGELDSLKRFKDDVSEVKSGYDCGLNIKNFNDLQEHDTIEVFEQREVKRTL